MGEIKKWDKISHNLVGKLNKLTDLILFDDKEIASLSITSLWKSLNQTLFYLWLLLLIFYDLFGCLLKVIIYGFNFLLNSDKWYEVCNKLYVYNSFHLASSTVGPSSNTLGFYIINIYKNFNLTRKIFLNINIKLKSKQLS